MRYDSSMTHLHDTVMANLRRMCSRDKAIIEQYCTGDATPAQLQDFLKSNCSNSGNTDILESINFWCSKSKGVEIKLGFPVNNDGDKTLTLSWSQATKFIMNNWKEILGKSEPEETVELNPINADISVLDLTVQSYNALKRMEINTVAELETRTADIMKMLPKTYPRIFKAVEKYTGKPIASSENKSVCTYNEIFLEHFPDFDVSRFDKFAVNFCIAIFFDDIGQQCPYAGEDGYGKCKKHWENQCLFEWRKEIDESDLKDVEEYLIPKADETPAQEIVPANAEKYVFACDGCKYDKQGCCNYPETQNDYCVNGDKKICSDPPAQNDTAATVFDYSELDSDTADKLRAVSEKVISIKARYIIETAKQVKIAHDLLAKCGNGNFGKWCESVGFSRHTGNNLVHVAETFPDFEIVENFDNLSPSLLYAASKPSAPPELVEAVKSGDITSHKDFVAMKKQLEEANGRAEEAEMLSRTYKQNYDQMNKNFQEACEDNTELEKRIKELESRPRDVYVDNNEMTRRISEAVNKINTETEQKIAAREQEFAENLHLKDERIWALEDKLKELNGSVADTGKKIYLVSMTDDDYRDLLINLNGSSFRKIFEEAVIADIK